MLLEPSWVTAAAAAGRRDQFIVEASVLAEVAAASSRSVVLMQLANQPVSS